MQVYLAYSRGCECATGGNTLTAPGRGPVIVVFISLDNSIRHISDLEAVACELQSWVVALQPFGPVTKRSTQAGFFLKVSGSLLMTLLTYFFEPHINLHVSKSHQHWFSLPS